MIRALHLGKSFGSVRALRDVSFKIAEGERVGFVGPNGAGKTTALRILSGFLSPDSGQAFIAGISLAGQREAACAALGYMPDRAPLQADMRVGEFLLFRARLKGVPRSMLRSRLAKVVEELDLRDVEKRLVGRLSRGYRQRVALADVLVADPKVLLLDEPTTGLDPLQRRSFRELLVRLSRGRSVLFSSHLLPEVDAVAERILVLRSGELVADGTLEELREKTELSAKHSSEEVFAKLVEGP